MKKILLIICAFMIAFNFVNVYAKDYQLFDKDTTSDCQGILGTPNGGEPNDTADYIQLAINVIRFVGIILCILLTAIDFFKAIVGDEKDMLKGITKKALSRLIYVACLFFLPSVVNFILTFLGIYGTCGIN